MTGGVFKVGDGVSTDSIIPGRYNVTLDLSELARYCLIEFKPEFASTVKPGDVLVAGRNFGCGSSREHAPLSIKATGVQAVVARSFARIFYRNAINVGLPILQCDLLYNAVAEGDAIEVDVRAGTIHAGGRRFQAEPLPAVALRIVEAGGIVDLIKNHGWEALDSPELLAKT